MKSGTDLTDEDDDETGLAPQMKRAQLERAKAHVDSPQLKLRNIPSSMSEDDLVEALERLGTIVQLHLVVDREVDGSRSGQGTMRFLQRSSADAAVADDDLPFQVDYEEGEVERLRELRLFVTRMGAHFSEEQLRDLFSSYGRVQSVTIKHKGRSHFAFVQYEQTASCQRAIDALDGVYTVDGEQRPLVVQEARPDGSLYSKLPAPAAPPINRLKRALQSESFEPHSRPLQMPALLQMPVQYVHVYEPTSFYYHQMPPPLVFFPAPPPPMMAQQDASSPQYASGPAGANLFLFHLPLTWTDDDLLQHFSPFGNIVSANVFVDKAAGGASKGFGFVSYDNPASAQLAIEKMNGLEVLGKKLRVELKKKKKNMKRK